MRRPVFGRHGPWVVRALCSYELVALLPGSPFPTLTKISDRHRWLKWGLVGVLGHHLFIEVTQ